MSSNGMCDQPSPSTAVRLAETVPGSGELTTRSKNQAVTIEASKKPGFNYDNVADILTGGGEHIRAASMNDPRGPRPSYAGGTISERAAALYDEALVWDMTLPWVEGYADEDVTLPRFRAAGIDAVSLTVNDFPGSIDGTVRHIAKVRAHVSARSDQMVLIHGADDIVAAKRERKLALTLNLQETNPLERSLEMIQVYYDLGVRHMLLAYNQKNFVGDGCAEPTDAGLSRFGVRVVEEMNRVGMLVDGTHSGRRTTMEAMEVATKPFIFSHCCVAGVVEHYRNITDEQIKACAASGGVIGMNGVGRFLDDKDATTESMFRHLDYVAGLVGPSHVGIGLDYVKNAPRFWDSARAAPEAWPLIGGKPHEDHANAQPEQLLELTELMLEHGYADDDVRGILGENFLRIAREVWA